MLATEPLAAQAAQSGAGEPLSAIDWLSDSVSLPSPVITPAPVAPPAAPVPSVTVLPLGAPVADDAGLFEAQDIGLPRNLWGGSSAKDLARSFLAVPEISTPSLRDYFASLAMAKFDPPVDAAIDSSLYLARLDTLLSQARLDDAEALIEVAGPPTPQSFRRTFDIALLKGTENEEVLVICNFSSQSLDELVITLPKKLSNIDWEDVKDILTDQPFEITKSEGDRLVLLLEAHQAVILKANK